MDKVAVDFVHFLRFGEVFRSLFAISTDWNIFFAVSVTNGSRLFGPRAEPWTHSLWLRLDPLQTTRSSTNMDLHYVEECHSCKHLQAF